jgi:transcriptional regulator with XRE-family HTH domain
MTTLAERLRQAIELRQTTVNAVESGAGLARGHVHRLVAGTRTEVTVRTIVAIADYLDISCEWLLRGAGPIERSAIPSWGAAPPMPRPPSGPSGSST